MSSNRWRYDTANGRMRTVVRVSEHWRKHWWQFWRARYRERDYEVEPFTGRMTPLADDDITG